MEFLTLLSDGRVQAFLLLLLRFSGVLAFFPLFDSPMISVSIKGALVFFLTILFFSITPEIGILSVSEFVLAGIFEIMLGFLGSVILQVIFGAVSFGGDNISFAMGLTLASAFDPISGTQKSIISQVLALLALLLALSFNFHHVIFEFIAMSLKSLPIGSFRPSSELLFSIVKFIGSIFLIGFAISLPILGVILLSDIIFGMIMKVHPQFNLLVIGFPFKIGLAFVCIIVLLPVIMSRFERELRAAFLTLKSLFF